ncbi:DoxX family membrane protein [Sphingopyxis sp.]|uniref:DoxX family membrane protein n=1 Tax=Sphingopyxis sp. TaxID=1908224 RepID=UPI001D6C13B5|nr:DoxX family membrane protein [Sphingopyxis sp.]MBW8294383.1 DoxX family membrane protein [Sphingopyxis sp.]
MRATSAWFRDLDRGLWLPRWLAHRAETIFRIALSLIFIIGGLGHFVQLDEMLQRIDESPWRDQVVAIGDDPGMLLWLSGGVFILFGLLLALGLVRRLSALLLFVTLVPITVSVHNAPGYVGPLRKNVAILGALLFIYTQRGRVR